jgi:cephalosporin-C deacetylase-like acetyl esterase
MHRQSSARLLIALLPVLLLPLATARAADERFPAVLPKTKPLTIKQPLDEVMVAGINRFAERELKLSVDRRRKLWNRDYRNRKAYETSVAENRERLKTYLGVVDLRVKEPRFEILTTASDPPTEKVEKTRGTNYVIRYVRWRVMRGVTGEGLLIDPRRPPKARVIAIPDANWTPEQFAGIGLRKKPKVNAGVKMLVLQGCQVLIPTIINREDTYSGNPNVRYTNQPHREFLYRMSFEMGRHIIGYEVQKVLSAVDAFHLLNEREKREVPIGVYGAGEGGLLAFYSAAVDTRIDAAMVSGYFQERENVWREPIYRNVWGLLTEFGDAEIASLIAPRNLVIDTCTVPEVDGPPKVKPGRSGGAAPGRIRSPDLASVQREFKRARSYFSRANAASKLFQHTAKKGDGPGNANGTFLSALGVPLKTFALLHTWQLANHDPTDPRFNPAKRQERQFRELVNFTQNLLRESDHVRDRYWADAKRTSLKDWMATSRKYRKHVWEEMIGRLPDPTMPPNVRTRKVLDKPKWVGYEVVIDVYPDVIAAGILLLPKDLKPGEKRPVVVCQHGLEGVPMDTISTTGRGYQYYKAFTARLAERGFITYAPQNPYRGHDKFRVIQRKSNPLKRSLFSYIIPQHQRTLQWLATLPNVDQKRIAFYGLSYGGKTAVRVPPILVPPRYRGGEPPGSRKMNDAPDCPGYCLSICSADFNEWVKKNVSNIDRYSYMFTGEYEMVEWNMGHTANYAELSYLMTPRPFMVERGHNDGVAPDEWVAWEFAKVRRHYDRLGLQGKAQIEFFNGPHTINGKGTFAFLHKYLNWPEQK